jgi:hypothetical protein
MRMEEERKEKERQKGEEEEKRGRGSLLSQAELVKDYSIPLLHIELS